MVVGDSSALERNLQALRRKQPALASKLADTRASRSIEITTARDGSPVPKFVNDGHAYPLHSLVGPRREAERVARHETPEGFVFAIGLGGGYHLRALLAAGSVDRMCVVECDPSVVRALLTGVDLSDVLADPRVTLHVVNAVGAQQPLLHDVYHPMLDGTATIIPLRAYERSYPEGCSLARNAVNELFEQYRNDLSTQARFGKLWTANLIRNLITAPPHAYVSGIRNTAVVVAAGPSLDAQAPLIHALRNSATILATDTALPALVRRGLSPHVVVSVDCQHISYLHFLPAVNNSSVVTADLTSPPILTRRATPVCYAAGGHPLAQYFAEWWPGLPCIDTSAGSVTHAAVSYASTLGAENILVFGADFSYPNGALYARGTYLYDVFRSRAARTNPLSRMTASFLFDKPVFCRSDHQQQTRIYTTDLLEGYRRRLIDDIQRTTATVHFSDNAAAADETASLVHAIKNKTAGPAFGLSTLTDSRTGRDGRSAEALSIFGELLESLPPPTEPLRDYVENLSDDQKRPAVSLLPVVAGIRSPNQGGCDASDGPCARFAEAIAWVRKYLQRQGASPP